MNNLMNIEGIGEKVCESLNDAGIYNLEDLIYYYPIKYNILKRSEVDNLKDNDKLVLDGNLDGQATLLTLDEDLTKIIFRLKSGKDVFNISVYNQEDLMSRFKIGCELTIVGHYNKAKNAIVADKIEFEKLPLLPVIEPIYKSIKGIGNKQLNKYIMDAIEMFEEFSTILPREIEEKYGFCDKRNSLKDIHNPNNIGLLKKARQRIKYEEIYTYLLDLESNLKKMGSKCCKYNISQKKWDEDFTKLNININNDAFLEIIKDLKEEKNMKRLLQTSLIDDKINTLVAVIYYNYLCGNKSLVVIKDNYLRKCIFNKLKKVVDNIIDTDKIIDDIDKYNVVISNYFDYKFNKLTLVITDVYNRFNVFDKENIRYKNEYIDYLFINDSLLDENILKSLYYDVDVTNIFDSSISYNETTLMKDDDWDNIKECIKELCDNGERICVYAKTSNSLLEVFLDKQEIKYKKINSNDKESQKVIKEFSKKTFPVLITDFIDYSFNTNLIILNGDNLSLTEINYLRNNISKNKKLFILSNDMNERIKFVTLNNDTTKLFDIDFKYKGDVKYRERLNLFTLTNINKDFNLIERIYKDLKEILDRDIYIDIC